MADETFPTNEFIEIAGVKMTKGTLAILVVGFVLAIIATLALPNGWIMGLFILLASFLVGYIQNCVVVGHCTTLAVFLLVIYIFNAISTMAAVMILKGTLKNLKSVGRKSKK